MGILIISRFTFRALHLKVRNWKMRDTFTLLAVACLCHIISTQSDVRLPPELIRGPERKLIVYRTGESVTLECIAKGTPDVRYEWTKNSFRLNTTSQNIRRGSDGTITIDRAQHTDEGYYQCNASNRYGTALSNTTYIRRAFVFSDGGFFVRQNMIEVNEGRPIHIRGEQEECYPKPQYLWEYSPQSTPLLPSKRIQIAANGDLHFAFALPEDDRNRKVYRCIKFNHVLDVRRRGCYTQVTVTRSTTGNISESVPTLAFSSESETIAVVGESVTLRCFFYGYPMPDISWIGPTNAVSIKRFSLRNFETQLVIDKVTALDEGEYNCTGTNAKGHRTHTIQLRVEAAPKFENMKDGPYNVNLTEGESVTFNCNATAEPQANIVWLQNGQPIHTGNPPERFVFSNDLKSLTIWDVCRDCFDPERHTDLMVIQCNASNVHGYTFAQGYLNVLQKTTLTISGSKEISVDLLRKQELLFHCHVTSDPSTTPTAKWFKIEPYGDPVHDEPPYIFVEENEFLIIVFYPNCSANCTKYLGEYRCDGSNIYSSQTEKIKVSYRYGPQTDKFRRSGYVWISWKIILGAGGITLVLFLFGIFIGFLSNRRSENAKRRMKNRKVPNPPSRPMHGHEGYDSDSTVPQEAMGRNERSLQRESSTYECIDYATFRQMLEEKGRTGETMPRSSGAHAYSRNVSIDSPQ